MSGIKSIIPEVEGEGDNSLRLLGNGVRSLGVF